MNRSAALYWPIDVLSMLATGTQQVTFPNGVDVALVPSGSGTDRNTVWTNYTPDATGTVLPLIAGPECFPIPTGALASPSVGADLYIRVRDTPEIVVPDTPVACIRFT